VEDQNRINWVSGAKKIQNPLTINKSTNKTPSIKEKKSRDTSFMDHMGGGAPWEKRAKLNERSDWDCVVRQTSIKTKNVGRCSHNRNNKKGEGG